MAENNITFKIEGNNNETELFDFEMVQGEKTTFSNIFALV